MAEVRVLVIAHETTEGADRLTAELTRRGVAVDRSTTAADGVERAMRSLPDLVVIHGPIGDGPSGPVAILAALKAPADDEPFASRVIVIPANPSSRQRLLVAMEGAIAYIPPDVDVEETADRVLATLEGAPEPVVRRRVQHEALRIIAATESGDTAAEVADPFAAAKGKAITPRARVVRPIAAASERTTPHAPGSDRPDRRDHPRRAVITETVEPLGGWMLRTAVDSLTPRQQYVLAVIGTCDVLADAARQLDLSPSTLSTQLKAIASRLGISSGTDLVNLARQHAVLDASDDAIIAVDSAGVIRYANRSTEVMFGFGHDDLVGRSLHEALHTPPDESEHGGDCTWVMPTVATGEARSGEETLWHRDGSRVEVAYRVAHAGETADDGVAILTLQNITARKHLTAQAAASAQNLDLVMDALDVLVFQLDPATGDGTSSRMLDEFIGLPRGTLTNLGDFLRYVHPEDAGLVDVASFFASGNTDVYVADFRVQLPGRGTRWISVRARLVDGTSGARTVVGVLSDITERLSERAVHQIMLESSNDAIVGLDRQGVVTSWNDATETIFGVDRVTAVGQPVIELIIPVRHRDAHYQQMKTLVTEAQPGSPISYGPYELTGRHADGREFPMETSFTVISLGDRVAAMAMYRDISWQRQVEEDLLGQAINDPLTGLPNRAMLFDRVDRAILQMTRTERPVSLLFVDIDLFSVVNESLGHGAGDEYLQIIASRLRDKARYLDTVARYGGDEFVVVCEATTVDAAFTFANHLLDELSEPVVVAGRELVPSLSIGVSTVTDPSTDAAAAIRDADSAMHRAKSRGRGRAELFDRSLREAATKRLEMEADLRRGIERGELVVHYQPIVGLPEGKILGFEALVRWNHPDRGLVPPLDFIPIAEETGLIIDLGERVLQTACADLAQWHRRFDESLTISVNLASRQLTGDDIVAKVVTALEANDLPPSCVRLEITETTLMDASAGEEMHRLREAGVGLAIDDFGTGYSSLLYLRDFPVQHIKLDRQFVSAMTTNGHDETIVRAVIDLAQALNLTSIAEGVETTEQREALSEMGCDAAQGYLFSRPVPAEEIEDIVVKLGGTRS